MTREQRKRARRHDVFRTIGVLTVCILIWVAASYVAETIVPVCI